MQMARDSHTSFAQAQGHLVRRGLPQGGPGDQPQPRPFQGCQAQVTGALLEAVPAYAECRLAALVR